MATKRTSHAYQKGYKIQCCFCCQVQYTTEIHDMRVRDSDTIAIILLLVAVIEFVIIKGYDSLVEDF